ncbi:MAG: hypothetical protein AABZ30_13125 [Myxococcota bacterium]
MRKSEPIHTALLLALALGCSGQAPPPKTAPKLAPAALPAPAKGPASAAPVKPRTLYERLGGEVGIAALSEKLIEAMKGDAELGKNVAVSAALERGDTVRLKKLTKEFLCWASGGPQKYSGRALGEAHAPLRISQRDWELSLAHLRATLDALGVGGKERAELLALFEHTRGEIVQTLYDRMGGERGVNALAGDLVDALAKDRKLRKNKTVKAAFHEADPWMLRRLVADTIGQSTGGPQKYEGPPLAEALATVGFGDAEWDIATQILASVLHKHDVPPVERDELLRLAMTTKAELARDLARPKAEPAPE